VKNLRIARWTVEYDPEVTRSLYAKIPIGRAEACCGSCRNFASAREQAYSPYIRSLLETLDIDLRKEEDVIHHPDPPDPLHHYEGLFWFAGRITSGRDGYEETGKRGWKPDFEKVDERTNLGITLGPFRRAPKSQGTPWLLLVIETKVPWVSEEEEHW